MHYPAFSRLISYVSLLVAGLTHRNTGAAWPPPPSVSADGRNAAACPAGPEPPDSPGAGSPSG